MLSDTRLVREAYRAFVRERIEMDRLSFHPDTPFASYVHMGSGECVYTASAAATLQREHDDLATLGDFDPYEATLSVMEELGFFRAELAARANRYSVGRTRRDCQKLGCGCGAPHLTEDSARPDLIRWLVWYDPNGCWTDEERAQNHWAVLTIVELWGVVSDAIEGAP